jgi:hypothetical protein
VALKKWVAWRFLLTGDGARKKGKIEVLGRRVWACVGSICCTLAPRKKRSVVERGRRQQVVGVNIV